MRFGREKVVAALALLILVGGLYRVIVALVTPAPDIEIRDTSLPEPSSRAVTAIRYSRFESQEMPARNPFHFSEGWTRLDSLPLSPPPYPRTKRILPLIGDIGSRGDADAPSFLWVEPPVEVLVDEFGEVIDEP